MKRTLTTRGISEVSRRINNELKLVDSERILHELAKHLPKELLIDGIHFEINTDLVSSDVHPKRIRIVDMSTGMLYYLGAEYAFRSKDHTVDQFSQNAHELNRKFEEEFSKRWNRICKEVLAEDKEKGFRI